MILAAAKALGWQVSPGSEEELRPSKDEIVSFILFHEYVFGLLVHPFLWELLYFYGLHLHNLTPERILQFTSESSSCCARVSQGFFVTSCCGVGCSGWSQLFMAASPLGWALPQSRSGLRQWGAT